MHSRVVINGIHRAIGNAYSMAAPRQTAYPLIDAATILEDVSNWTQKPSSERQARPLASVPRESRAEAWQHALDTAPLNDSEEPVITANGIEERFAGL